MLQIKLVDSFRYIFWLLPKQLVQQTRHEIVGCLFLVFSVVAISVSDADIIITDGVPEMVYYNTCEYGFPRIRRYRAEECLFLV